MKPPATQESSGKDAADVNGAKVDDADAAAVSADAPAANAASVRRRRRVTRAGLLFATAFLLVLAAASAALWRGLRPPPERQLVLYFNENVSGLTTGSGVRAHGVPVGKVVSIGLLVPRRPGGRYHAAVRVALDARRLRHLGVHGDFDSPAALDRAIASGLRGKLVLLSPIVGEYGIELASHPGTPRPLVSRDEQSGTGAAAPQRGAESGTGVPPVEQTASTPTLSPADDQGRTDIPVCPAATTGQTGMSVLPSSSATSASPARTGGVPPAPHSDAAAHAAADILEIPVLPGMLSGEKLVTLTDRLADFSRNDFAALEREWNATLDHWLHHTHPATVTRHHDNLTQTLARAGDHLAPAPLHDRLAALNAALDQLRQDLDRANVTLSAANAPAVPSPASLSVRDLASLTQSLAAVRASLAETACHLAAANAALSVSAETLLPALESLRETAASIHRATPAPRPEK